VRIKRDQESRVSTGSGDHTVVARGWIKLLVLSGEKGLEGSGKTWMLFVFSVLQLEGHQEEIVTVPCSDHPSHGTRLVQPLGME